MAVPDFVTGVQGVTDAITRESLEKRFKAVQDQMDQQKEQMVMLEREKQRIAEMAKQDTKGEKRAAAVAVERGGKAGKPSKKGQHLLAQKNKSAVRWQ